MTTLRAAVRAYLAMRRDLGFHLRETGRLLLQFVAFMEQHRATTITTRLALTWAQQPQTAQPAEWARRLSMVRIFARYRRAFDPRTEIPPDGLLPYVRSGRDPTGIRMRRFVASCTPPAPCRTTINAGRCARGSTPVCSGS